MPHNDHLTSTRCCRPALWPALLVATCVTGCSTVTVQSFEAAPESRVEAAYVATGADFSRYSRLLGEDMGIFSPQARPLSAADAARLREIFRTAFLARLDGYTITDQPAPDVMTVQASLIDRRDAGLSDVPDMRAGLDTVARPGVLVFTMEMRDSTSGKVLARAADSTANPRIGGGAGAATDWAEVQAAADHWAALFRRFLDQNLAQ